MERLVYKIRNAAIVFIGVFFHLEAMNSLSEASALSELPEGTESLSIWSLVPANCSLKGLLPAALFVVWLVDFWHSTPISGLGILLVVLVSILIAYILHLKYPLDRRRVDVRMKIWTLFYLLRMKASMHWGLLITQDWFRGAHHNMMKNSSLMFPGKKKLSFFWCTLEDLWSSS